MGPEFEIFTPPLAIGFMNGLTSLIEHGLGPAHCETGGMGFAAPSNCSVGELHLGELECLQPTIDQMDLLLTGAKGGRGSGWGDGLGDGVRVVRRRAKARSSCSTNSWQIAGLWGR